MNGQTPARHYYKKLAFSFFIGFIASSKNDTFFVVSHILFKKMSENVFIFLKKGM